MAHRAGQACSRSMLKRRGIEADAADPRCFCREPDASGWSRAMKWAVPLSEREESYTGSAPDVPKFPYPT